MITTCPGRKVGTTTRWTSVKKTAVSVLPSTVMAAWRPPRDRAPNTVIFFPLLAGLEAYARSPWGARAECRALAMLTPVSSRNTRSVASSVFRFS